MITVSGQLTDQLRDKKDFISSLLTKVESLVTSYPMICYFPLTPTYRQAGPLVEDASGAPPCRGQVTKL